MADFRFLQNPLSRKWVILAPRRAKRPDVGAGTEPVCPFCIGREIGEQEAFRVPAKESFQSNQTVQSSNDQNWKVRVINNKFPFAPIHELVIHSPSHYKNFGEFPLDHVFLILETYRLRYNVHKDKGHVYIFHNRGLKGGESLPHAHTQIAVIPSEVSHDIPRLDPSAFTGTDTDALSFGQFSIFCPQTSQWPDEVWIAPKLGGRAFGEITDREISDLSFILTRLILIFDLRHGNNFPYNFYIYPGGDWYLRIIPRIKTLGGFEVGSGIFVNTQDPKETIAFIQKHFKTPDYEKISQDHQAEYHSHGV